MPTLFDPLRPTTREGTPCWMGTTSPIRIPDLDPTPDASVWRARLWVEVAHATFRQFTAPILLAGISTFLLAWHNDPEATTLEVFHVSPHELLAWKTKAPAPRKVRAAPPSLTDLALD